MATTVVINGLNYYIPAVGDNNWGQNVTDSVVALATAASANASVYNRVTVTSSPITVVSGRTYLVDTSSARTLNLPAPANNAYLLIKDTTGGAASNNITVHRFGSESIDGVASDKTLNLNRGFWAFVSDGTNWFSVTPPWPVPYSFLNLTGSILSADLAGSIAVNKLVALSTSKAVATDGSGFLVASAVTATELGYLSGVTSAIQTQLNLLAPIASPTFTGTVTAPIITSGSASPATVGVIRLANADQMRWRNSANSADLALRCITGDILEWTGSLQSDGTITLNKASNKLTLDGTSTTNQIGSNYDVGVIGNIANTSANINFNCPTTNAQVTVGVSATANTAPSTVATFSNAGVSILGTNTNDNAAAGNVGEAVSSTITFTNAAANGAYGDLTSISLTAGDWDVSAIGDWTINGATVAAGNDFEIGISTTSGNSGTGLTTGDTQAIGFLIATTVPHVTLTIPPKRFSVSVTTTVYLKYRGNYTGGPPQCTGRISARRVR